MSILRKLAITTLIADAMLAAPSAAFASATGQATTQAAVTAVHRAPCTPVTFNVYHDTSKRTCYAGTGTIRPDIRNVREVTTGEYWGCFVIRAPPGGVPTVENR